jgi:hypothetical protein
MADLININTEEAAKKLQIINKNFIIIICICFASSIIYLYISQQKQNEQLIEYLTSDVRKTTQALEGNNIIIKQNTEALNDIKTAIQTKLKSYEHTTD